MFGEEWCLVRKVAVVGGAVSDCVRERIGLSQESVGQLCSSDDCLLLFFFFFFFFFFRGGVFALFCSG